jgi:hypothetical protein
VKEILTSPKFITITVAILALVIIPLTLIEVQSQQSLRQNAETILWAVTQSASTACATDGSGINITVTFTNTETPSSSTTMNVTAKDQQTGKSVNMGSIKGGVTKTSTIATGKTTLNAGTVTFALSWTDGHSGTDSRTANYSAVSKCVQPTPTPTYPPTPTPTVPPGQPTPTICPTLGPVQNVHIDCPNCKVSPSPSPNPSPYNKY